MNVVVLTDFAEFNGGASKVALLSARALALRGHHVHLLAGAGPIDPSLLDKGGLVVESLGEHDVFSNPNRLAAAMHGIWNRKASRRLHEVLKELSPKSTVVHLHLWGKALTSSVVRTASNMGFSVVLTLHDFLSVCPAGTLFQHGSQTICKLKPMSLACIGSNCDAHSYGHKLWRVGRQLAQQGPGRLPSSIGCFIAISPTCRAVMRDLLPPGARFEMVSNPVEITRQTPSDVAGNTRFVFLGRLAAEKGPVLFAEAAASAGVPALFVGEGDLRDAVMAANPNAEVTGWQPAESTQALLRTARALVFPSLWQETQGLVVAEALALGVPVVVADTSAARDWIEDGVTGLLFRSGNALDLASKLVWLNEHPQDAARMGRLAYDRYWISPATLQRHVTELEAVYASICAPQGVLA